ncbi:MAG: class I SAM-dependent methyltransferase [Bacteroidales bacterium]|jgi:hypothetical protein|nr:class I SAM-dependent methyltransferase [Bacteroidales bacterium]
MTKEFFYKQADIFSEILQSINFDSLPISDYNKKYIKHMKTSFKYYCKIFADCLYLISNEAQDKNITLIDYGGGAGFLSVLAKKCGFKNVIYVDRNPLSVETAIYLKNNCFNCGADIFIEGDTKDLIDYVKNKNICPDSLIATDLIEHIYNLDIFFSDLKKINPKMNMTFTTGSTPFNPIKKHKLHKIMDDCETGSAEIPNYYTLRFDYIEAKYPNFTKEDKNKWAEATRGLTFDDIDKTIQNNILPKPADKHNTCDPRNGNWEERILTTKEYKKVLEPLNYKMSLYKGYYNSLYANSLKSITAKLANLSIKILGKVGFYISPMIILYIEPK